MAARSDSRVTPASAAFDLAAEQAEPHNAAYEKADRAFTAAKRVADIERFHHQVEEMQRRGPTREAAGLSL